ncbi:MAG: aldo/keto reductase [Bacteroidales bacterium]
MKQRTVPLGKTEIRITPVGLGTWQFSGGKGMTGSFWNAIPPDKTYEIVRTALEGGINWFDTAEAYGRGRSEASLAQALKTNNISPDDVVIATKWWPLFRRAKNMLRTVDDRLRHLNGYGIGLFQVHMPVGFSPVEAEMKAMARLAEQGKIRSVGVSNFSAGQMVRAHKTLRRMGLTLASHQVKYSLLDRKIEQNGILQAAKELGITLIAYSPLEQGILTGKFHRDPDRIRFTGYRKWRRLFRRPALQKTLPLIRLLEEVAENHHTTPAAVALHWTIRFHGDTVVAIPGASKPGHIQAHIDALRINLGQEELHRINTTSKTVCRELS